MKNKLIIVLVFILNTTVSDAQEIMPVENVYQYRMNGVGLPQSTISIKDVNNVLQRFVGTWVGIYGTKTFEIRIVRGVEPFFEGTEDVLLLRYKITASNGFVLDDTTQLPDSDGLVIGGNYLQKRTYVFTYQGGEWECGQAGEIFISTGYDGNPNKMGLFLARQRMLIDNISCPNGVATQIIPTEMMWLYRQ